ncbi:MAG: hydroxyacid dehydrogenase [Nitrospiraceae bacterium]|nr:hydroxyacid dehydrogenase [Nitrospiraceae bacterium]
MTQSAHRTTLLITREVEARCFRQTDLDRIAAITDLQRACTGECTAEWQIEAIAGAEIAITGWSSHPITDAMLDAAPGLRFICHSAGSIRWIIEEEQLRSRGLRISSARTALATGVAEFALGMMIASMKAVWQYTAMTGSGQWEKNALVKAVREPFGATLGIVGASCVGREMVRLCKHLALDTILLSDPYVSPEEAAEMGCVKVELDDLMRRSDVVSLHTPAIESCRHIINAENLALLRDGAIFINTARGMCVDEAALIAELERGRLVACLDVTDPEPPEPDSPLYRLPNCILTPHIAGGLKENCLRQGWLVANQIEAFIDGRPVPEEIALDQYARMA